MIYKELEEIDAALARLSDLAANMSHVDVEATLSSVLLPLLRTVGYQVIRSSQFKASPSLPVNMVDFAIIKEDSKTEAASEKIGLEFKYYRNKVGSGQVAQILHMARQYKFDRMVIVSNTNFTLAARALAERKMPFKIELLDYSDLKAWASSLRSNSSDSNLSDNTSVQVLVKALSVKFAQMIARDVKFLRQMEWYHLEDTMAEVFSGLGFRTTLTPRSKDGGKDLILEYRVNGAGVSFYVEIKHWRSSSKVNFDVVSDFLKVIVRDCVSGGLLLSSYGFARNAFEGLTEIERRKIYFGDKERITTLCQYYEKARYSFWSPPSDLGTLITEAR